MMREISKFENLWLHASLLCDGGSLTFTAFVPLRSISIYSVPGVHEPYSDIFSFIYKLPIQIRSKLRVRVLSQKVRFIPEKWGCLLSTRHNTPYADYKQPQQETISPTILYQNQVELTLSTVCFACIVVDAQQDAGQQPFRSQFLTIQLGMHGFGIGKYRQLKKSNKRAMKFDLNTDNVEERRTSPGRNTSDRNGTTTTMRIHAHLQVRKISLE